MNVLGVARDVKSAISINFHPILLQYYNCLKLGSLRFPLELEDGSLIGGHLRLRRKLFTDKETIKVQRPDRVFTAHVLTELA